jgi:hypothetical protein
MNLLSKIHDNIVSTFDRPLFQHSQTGADQGSPILLQKGKTSIGHTVVYAIKAFGEMLNLYAEAPNNAGVMAGKVTGYVVPFLEYVSKKPGEIKELMNPFEVFSNITDVLGFSSTVGYFFDGQFLNDLRNKRFEMIGVQSICLPLYATSVAQFGASGGLWSMKALENFTAGFGRFPIFGLVGKAVPFLQKYAPTLAPSVSYISNIRFLPSKSGLDNAINLSILSIHVLLAKDAYNRKTKYANKLEKLVTPQASENQEATKLATDKYNLKKKGYEVNEELARLDKWAAGSEILMRGIPALGFKHPIIKGVLGIFAIGCTARSLFYRNNNKEFLV